MDLASASVFLDFDGTMTVVDSGVHLLERLSADRSWQAIDELYAAGAIGRRAVRQGTAGRVVRGECRRLRRIRHVGRRSFRPLPVGSSEGPLRPLFRE